MPGVAQAGSITVPSGAEFVANFQACVTAVPSFRCPPQALMLAVDTVDPANGSSGYSLEAWLISTATGQFAAIGDNFVFWISTINGTGERLGIFGYNGLSAGFPFPNDPGFWGPTPSTATFSVLYRNTGLPFTFWHSPETSVIANADSAGSRWAVAANSVTLIPEVAPVPETSSFWLLSLGLAAFSILPRRTHR
jgi:hypothetical protein